jgi:hypothetical protein
MWTWLAESACSPFDMARGTYFTVCLVCLGTGVWFGWLITYSYLKPYIKRAG